MKAVLRLDDRRAGAGLRAADLLIQGESRRIEFRDLDGPLSPDVGADPFLLSTLLLWMANGTPLHIEGVVSRRLLANVEEWQEVWARWRPSVYRRINISADEVEDVVPASGPAIIAFSGGVDSVYSLHRHLHGATQWRTVRIASALLVHGFDVPLNKQETFESVVQRSLRILEGTDVRLRRLRTNFQDLGQEWEDACALAVGACLTLYGDTHEIGLIGSTAPYDALVLPLGSNPITDPLLSGGHLTIQHDGAGMSRTEKVAALLDWQDVVPWLRFCWEGRHLDQNCGRCEKCLRTACCFYAAGELRPPCFNEPPSPQMVGRIRVYNMAQLTELRSILAYAQEHAVQGPWLKELRRACVVNSARQLARHAVAPTVTRTEGYLRRMLSSSYRDWTSGRGATSDCR
jgi:hypothetical protein